MRRLIINADDFGHTRGINLGIVEAFQKGILTSTTFMVNTPYFEETVKLAKEVEITTGLHLTFTCRKPISRPEEVSSLIDTKGDFHTDISVLGERCQEDEIKKEVAAQVYKFLSSGLTLTHIDSHHHVHTHPRIFKIVADKAKELGVPIRTITEPQRKYVVENKGKTTNYFYMDFNGTYYELKDVSKILDSYETGTMELMCHPAVVDNDEILKISSYNYEREKELKLLTSPKAREIISEMNIELINFSHL